MSCRWWGFPARFLFDVLRFSFLVLFVYFSLLILSLLSLLETFLLFHPSVCIFMVRHASIFSLRSLNILTVGMVEILALCFSWHTLPRVYCRGIACFWRKHVVLGVHVWIFELESGDLKFWWLTCVLVELSTLALVEWAVWVAPVYFGS